MTQRAEMAAPTAPDSHARLCDAISELEHMDREPRVRLALAEAEFRVATASATKPGEAVERLRRAISYDPFLPKLYLHLGRLLQLSGQHRAALSEYRKAIRLAPSSRRAHTLMALALLELGGAEQELGQAIVRALSRNADEELRAAVADLDALVDDQSSAAARKGEPQARRTRRRSRPTAPEGRASESASAGVSGKADRASTDIWRVVLLEQLSRRKPVRAEIKAQLDAGSARIRDGYGLAEYAAACALMVANGDLPADVRKLARAAGLDQETPHPAVALLDGVLNLAETVDPDEFVVAATEHLRCGRIAAELICWLHFSKYAGLSAAESVRLLDRYPEDVRALDCFRELQVAVLDEHARRAWAAERFAEARLLWREAATLDPYRVPVAVNLALLAARTKSAEDYGPAWQRLAELLYLHAASAGDVQFLLDDRMALHLTLTQQSLHRHCPQTTGPDKPSRKELENWLADTEALDAWLTEWDLYYLNARLRFRSPVHLLGVPKDASSESLTEARDVLERHVESALTGQSWAGVRVFSDLARAEISEAFQRALDPVDRVRDPYYELEKPQADALTEEMLKRVLLLRRLMQVLISQRSAHRIMLGCSIAAREFALPRAVLQQLCVDRGLIGPDDELFEIFEADLIGLAVNWDNPKPAETDSTARRAALEECVTLLPHRLELRALLCQLLCDVGQRKEAYDSALKALDLPVRPDRAERDGELRRSLINLIDYVGSLEIPAELRQPRDVAGAEATIAVARKVLTQFPRCAALRETLANLLVQLGGDSRTREAVTSLAEGIELALSDEQRLELETQLASIRDVAATDAARTRVRNLAQPALDRVRQAVADLAKAPGPSAAQATLQVVRDATAGLRQALEAATTAGLSDEMRQLEEALSRWRQLEQQLEASEE